jgi:hypothetical protein
MRGLFQFLKRFLIPSTFWVVALEVVLTILLVGMIRDLVNLQWVERIAFIPVFVVIVPLLIIVPLAYFTSDRWEDRPHRNRKTLSSGHQYASDKYFRASARSTILNSSVMTGVILGFRIIGGQNAVVYLGLFWIGIMLADLSILYMRIKLGLFGFNRYEAMRFVEFLLADIEKNKTPPRKALMRLDTDDRIRSEEHIHNPAPEFGETNFLDRAGIRP